MDTNLLTDIILSPEFYYVCMAKTIELDERSIMTLLRKPEAEN